MTQTNESDEVGLASWMEGTPSNHPMNQSGMWPSFVAAMDEIIRSLELVKPLRLGRKRDTFRALRSSNPLLEQRAELLAASLLARAGLTFEFAADHPDLVLGQGRYGIEVGTRAIDSPWAIHDQLELRLAQRTGLHVVLTFDARPLKVAAAEVNRIVDSVAEHAFTEPATNLRFEEAGLTVAVTADYGVPGTQVVVNFGATSGSELTGHMAEIEREIDNKIAEKRRQALKLPTMLLLDVSRVGWSWLRPGSVWTSVLRSKLEGEPYVGLGLMVSTLDSSLPLQLHAVLDPTTAPAELEQAFDQIAKVFNLSTEP